MMALTKRKNNEKEFYKYIYCVIIQHVSNLRSVMFKR